MVSCLVFHRNANLLCYSFSSQAYCYAKENGGVGRRKQGQKNDDQL